MSDNIKVPEMNGNHKKPNVFLIFLLVILLLGAIGLGLYTVMTQQLSTKSRAEDVVPDPATIEETTEPTQVPEVSVPVSEPSTEPSAEPSAEPSTEPVVEPTVEPSVEPISEAGTLEESDTSIETQVATEEGAIEPTVAPTQALVSSLSCPANGASCAWDGVAGATSYNVTVVDKTTNDVVVTQTISGTSVSFTPIIEHTYQCSVQAVNECGVSSSASGENTCRSNVTPTVAQQPSATPTLGPSATPGPGPSATPTSPSGTVIVQSGEGPQPTIPTAGSASTVYFMVIATILVATLFLVF